jgi:hypothetical protein
MTRDVGNLRTEFKVVYENDPNKLEQALKSLGLAGWKAHPDDDTSLSFAARNRRGRIHGAAGAPDCLRGAYEQHLRRTAAGWNI